MNFLIMPGIAEVGKHIQENLYKFGLRFYLTLLDNIRRFYDRHVNKNTDGTAKI